MTLLSAIRRALLVVLGVLALAGTAAAKVHFEVLGFMAPLVVVRRRSDGRKGSLEFQHSPRLYYSFRPH